MANNDPLGFVYPGQDKTGMAFLLGDERFDQTIQNVGLMMGKIKELEMAEDEAKMQQLKSYTDVIVKGWMEKDRDELMGDYDAFKKEAVQKFVERDGRLSYEEKSALDKKKQEIEIKQNMSLNQQKLYDDFLMTVIRNPDAYDQQQSLTNLFTWANQQGAEGRSKILARTKDNMNWLVKKEKEVDYYGAIKEIPFSAAGVTYENKEGVTTSVTGAEATKEQKESNYNAVVRWGQSEEGQKQYKESLGKRWKNEEEFLNTVYKDKLADVGKTSSLTRVGLEQAPQLVGLNGGGYSLANTNTLYKQVGDEQQGENLQLEGKNSVIFAADGKNSISIAGVPMFDVENSKIYQPRGGGNLQLLSIDYLHYPKSGEVITYKVGKKTYTFDSRTPVPAKLTKDKAWMAKNAGSLESKRVITGTFTPEKSLYVEKDKILNYQELNALDPKEKVNVKVINKKDKKVISVSDYMALPKEERVDFDVIYSSKTKQDQARTVRINYNLLAPQVETNYPNMNAQLLQGTGSELNPTKGL